MVSNKIITTISNLNELKTIIQENKGLIIISFRATWCEPCKRVTPLIDGYLYNYVENPFVKVYIIDIDSCIQIYMELKRLRILTGIPSLICYENGNDDSFYPTDSVFGSNQVGILDFFNRCNSKLHIIARTK